LSHQDSGCEEKFTINEDRVSHLLPACNQDRIVRVYAKKPELVSEENIHAATISYRTHQFHFVKSPKSWLQVQAVSEAFENLQVRMYGEKTQVHDTPTKKRRMRFD
jgi:deoxyribose-phosphate aldolase